MCRLQVENCLNRTRIGRRQGLRNFQFVVATVIVIGLAAGARGDEPTTVPIGQAKVSWRDLQGVDGKKHALADLNKHELVVVVVTCNHCPIAIEYYDRMKEFVRKYGGADGKVALVAISLSNLETDRMDRMKEMSKRREFNFPYLHDASQQVGKKLGATNTPQCFILNQNRVLVYRGAWDDNINVAQVAHHYVDEAIDALLAGKVPPVTETKAKGCLIRYDQ